MKLLRKWKRVVVMAVTVIVLSGSITAPVMAHGHGSAHHGSSHHSSSKKGIYCSYHHKRHAKKSSCKNYCKVHKTIHKNGKRHHTSKR